jgi:hypothetical protein
MLLAMVLHSSLYLQRNLEVLAMHRVPCRETPILAERVYEDTVPVIAYTRLASLYDVGNRFIARADNSGWPESSSSAVYVSNSSQSPSRPEGAALLFSR